MVNYMRMHMVNKHGMSREEVNRITNRRKSAMELLTEGSGVGGESTAGGPSAGPPYSDAF